MPFTNTTIVAVSSPPGEAERAVIRLSGPATRSVVAVTVRVDDHPPELAERCALDGRFHDGVGSQPVLLLWMPGPHSYTREDVAELHLAGSPPLLERALEHLVELGCTPAEPGEFTRRAFLSGRLDLTQAEGVLTLVSAHSEAERRAAGALVFGGLGERVARLRARLEGLRALCEASLDFDEADAGHVDERELEREARGCVAALDEALLFEQRREPLTGVPRVVLAGPPNAGKSTLFNRLTGGRALVSQHAGTTRDPLRGIWRLASGHAVQLFDTAGTDELPTREPDRMAQELRRTVLETADLVLLVGQSLVAGASAGVAPSLVVRSKSDLEAADDPEADVSVSALTGQGLDALDQAVAGKLGLAGAAQPEGGAGVGRELGVRHRRALRAARAELDDARAHLARGAPLDLVAETLRAATDALDAISGRTTPEDLLDRIFARFCMGK